MDFDAEGLIASIRAANLNVYRASPTRLREDVGSEAEIAHDYNGRLVYELLQNADDSMAGSSGDQDRILFRLTDHELWVANTGHPLTEVDVRGLTATGAGTKTATGERRRASIGHKGMGFKSVLELTDRPEIYSTTCSFGMDADRARPEVAAVMEAGGNRSPDRVPIMRFPWFLEAEPPEWERYRQQGFNTLFRFPFRVGLAGSRRALVADMLLSLPVTSILFLKHLEQVEVEIDADGRSERFAWQLRRERRAPDGGWQACAGLADSGVYRVSIATHIPGEAWSFLLAHDADVAIGPHRAGLNDYAWEGVAFTEVTVAALEPGSADDVLPADWRRFHVFLPTTEPCPYGFLVNGAFATDLSRQEIRLGAGGDDYNRFLIAAAARTLRDGLFPEYLALGSKGLADLLSLLDRGAAMGAAPDDESPATALHRALVAALADHALLPAEAPDEPAISLSEAVVPTLASESFGLAFRALLPVVAGFEGRQFPAGVCSGGRLARVAVDHGVRALTPAEVAQALTGCDPARSSLVSHPCGKLAIDPVLTVLEVLWRDLDSEGRRDLEAAVRGQPLFPLAADEAGVVDRIAISDTIAFYPPRSLRGKVPLDGMAFLLQAVCWGDLTPLERGQVLAEQMPVWVALFGLHEFKFPEVMRASVLPLLDLESGGSNARQQLADLPRLAAICQLSGPTPTPSSPLPYERLGSQRALFNLCRLPVPCRINDGNVEWIPAYRVYFGRDWIDARSIETVLDALDPVRREALGVPILVERSAFRGLLARFRNLVEDGGAADDDAEEVGIEEDDEQPTESDEFDRWMAFLTWLGVNHSLRAVHFHDAEDQATGWLKTEGLARPGGWAFKTLDGVWDLYAAQIAEALGRLPAAKRATPYYYRVHDLEYLRELLPLAQLDTAGNLVQALFHHFALGWPRLERFAQVELALVPHGLWPNSRTAPPRARDDERHHVGEDFWLFRLRHAAFCPTKQGPRRPDQVWLLSAEIERRFGRSGADPADLLPILAVAAEANSGKARGFAQALAIRDSISPSNFTIEDAAALTTQLARRYGARGDALNEATLRLHIRPAYRNLFELLSGITEQKKERAADDAPPLGAAPLLVHNGHGGYRFDRADNVLYAKRSGPRELLGIDEPLWTFILEAAPAAERPLRTVFGARVLEDELRWTPQPGEPALTETGMSVFRRGLADMAPYVLARLRVERSEETQAQRDLSAIRSFIQQVEPVERLEVRCDLDGRLLPVARERSAYVGSSADGPWYLRWRSEPWSVPLGPEEAEALAVAITDLLQVAYFEPVLAILSAPAAGRARLLHLAGASSLLEAVRREWVSDLQVLPEPADAGVEPVVGPTPGDGTAFEPLEPSPRPWERPVSLLPRTPLFQPEALCIDGEPLLVRGLPRSNVLTTDSRTADSRTTGPGVDRATGDGTPYGGATDLEALDRLGMFIAMTYESRRLRRAGLEHAVFDPDDPQRSARVFDVSTRGAIDGALKHSKRFEQVLEALGRSGIRRDAPGFDILTLEDDAPDQIGRLIELKSSGNNARIQSMSWNEWKTARESSLRARFYLYLAGNLRSDLQDAAPFLLALKDPVGSLFATDRQGQQRTRSVQLNVQEFEEAERLALTVRALDG